MTTKEVISKLDKMCPEEYFRVRLFERDSRVFARRSLSDLSIYFKQWNVSEKQLLKALQRAGFVIRICGDIYKCITYKHNHKNFMPIAGTKYPDFYTFNDNLDIVDKFTKHYITTRFNYDL